mmetsp:Transcript_87868/g.253431  ORF Transcript_87868/g.253431 Transcript_87868/m.253431 type:complete len:204 (+) Transcript_87868:527-1138(+)
MAPSVPAVRSCGTSESEMKSPIRATRMPTATALSGTTPGVLIQGSDCVESALAPSLLKHEGGDEDCAPAGLSGTTTKLPRDSLKIQCFARMQFNFTRTSPSLSIFSTLPVAPASIGTGRSESECIACVTTKLQPTTNGKAAGASAAPGCARSGPARKLRCSQRSSQTVCSRPAISRTTPASALAARTRPASPRRSTERDSGLG